MRIIAGVAKGRSLSSVAGATRPTSDRAREAIFSTLTSEFGDFLGLHVLDVGSALPELLQHLLLLSSLSLLLLLLTLF